MKIFLGGTCNGDDWRKDYIIPILEKNNIDYFNPLVDDWTPECIEEENRQKEECDIHLYIITSNMTGVYSIAEVFDSLYAYNKPVIFLIQRDDFDSGQIKSLSATIEIAEKSNNCLLAMFLEHAIPDSLKGIEAIFGVSVDMVLKRYIYLEDEKLNGIRSIQKTLTDICESDLLSKLDSRSINLCKTKLKEVKMYLSKEFSELNIKKL